MSSESIDFATGPNGEAPYTTWAFDYATSILNVASPWKIPGDIIIGGQLSIIGAVSVTGAILAGTFTANVTIQNNVVVGTNVTAQNNASIYLLPGSSLTSPSIFFFPTSSLTSFGANLTGSLYNGGNIFMTSNQHQKVYPHYINCHMLPFLVEPANTFVFGSLWSNGTIVINSGHTLEISAEFVKASGGDLVTCNLGSEFVFTGASIVANNSVIDGSFSFGLGSLNPPTKIPILSSNMGIQGKFDGPPVNQGTGKPLGSFSYTFNTTYLAL